MGDMDISEIINKTPSDFNFGFTVDVTKMQKLFENLCFIVLDLQKELSSLRKDIKNKAENDQLDPLRDNIARNSENIGDLIERIDDLKSMCVEKLGVPSARSQASPKPRTIRTPDEESKTRPGSNHSNKIDDASLKDLTDRLKNCEDQISNLNEKIGKIPKPGPVLSEAPAKGTAQENSSRKQKFQDFLDELDSPPNKKAIVQPIKTVPAQKSPIVSPGRPNSGKKSTPISPKLSDLPTPASSKVESDDDNEDQQNKPKELAEIKEAVSRPIAPSEDLLETFLDAAKMEIENARKALADELNNQLKTNTIQLNGAITKTAATSEMGLKKANGKIIDTEAKLGENFTKFSTDAQKQIQQLNVELANMAEQVKKLENRVEASSKAAEMNQQNLKHIITDDGKLDTDKLLEQLQGLFVLFNDMDGRLVTFENREFVSPESFNAAIEALSQIDSKVNKCESQIVSTDMKVSELREIIHELKEQLGNQASREQLLEVERVLHDYGDETSNLREALVKANKDIINARAAINTLRSHSEETKSISDEAKSQSQRASDDVAANEKRMKKMLAFIQKETGELSTQIKDLNSLIDRNEESINEIQKQRNVDLVKMNAGNAGNAGISKINPSDSTKSNSSISSKSSVSKLSITLTSEATSPHTSVPQIDSTMLHDPDANVVQLPEKVVYEQPVVTVVRKKQIEVVESQQMRRGNLPRLNTQQTRRDFDTIRSDLKRYEELIPRVERAENSITSLKNAIDSLNRTSKNLTDNKADKNDLQTLFEQFRMALGELNNRLGGMRKQVATKADITEVRDIQKSVLKDLLANGETAAGTESVRCLMCGQSRTNVTGAIDDPTLMKAIGNAVSSRVTGSDGAGNVCFVYGEHGEMYFGRSPDGKPIYSKPSSLAESNLSETKEKPPMTAPMLARKILDVPNP
ncbi:hypothetical protein TRFO_07437 [Tritrichomonas foetus]|uniref:Uncharacterized protein n=1 Tax=Tritrichomonas foetus TaxID=1144522 RepID=A0A1J4JRU6_9EUKA|nr:hypothetical protein TRFO_07437 [Tritrichomonas foetus]|eukprot:OHT01857.1 hypothetical protein TRFO_07437 [Tritrichomonas foetus]